MLLFFIMLYVWTNKRWVYNLVNIAPLEYAWVLFNSQYQLKIKFKKLLQLSCDMMNYCGGISTPSIRKIRAIWMSRYEAFVVK